MNSESNESKSMLLSPNAMAEKAFADGVEDRERCDSEKFSSQKNTTLIDDENVRGEKKSVDYPQCLLFKNDKSDSIDLPTNKEEGMSGKKMLKPMPICHSNNMMAYDLLLDEIWKNLGNDSTTGGLHEMEDDHDTSSNDSETLTQKVKVALKNTKDLVEHHLKGLFEAGLESFHENDTIKRELRRLKEIFACQGREVQRLKAANDDSRSSLSVSLRFLLNESRAKLIARVFLLYSYFFFLHSL